MQASNATVSRPAGGARVQREVAANGAEMPQWLLWSRRCGALVVGLLVLVLLEQLLEVLAILDEKVFGALALAFLLLAGLQAVLEFGQLLGHDKVGVWVIVVVVLLQSLQGFAGTPLAGCGVQDTLLFSVLDAVGFATRHGCF